MCCNEMSDVKTKMHQIQFRLTALPDSLAGFRGPTCKGKGRDGMRRGWAVMDDPSRF